ncbi:hypothetical protein [Alkalisalibacterium limincola]|uniref:Alpha/beta hydrolase n=1 Tax=Alkalisalibacterium limincola TaxID=2699169 RepID=A0A5C8KXA8_9GAMM|nr:hypothetical protein [Alkalisalibacterium limincola]TXK64464.1 hypothetical protein FU658_06125 [Alkalisalibacterium limincola]
MNERVLAFQDGGFGILTPGNGNAREPRVLVLLNAGFMPRSGAFRLHVELARSLALRGITTVRCEMPGVGDSHGQLHWPAWPRQVLDQVCADTGCASVAVGGICSAADDAWRLAQVDERVDGLLLVDAFATGGFWLHWGRLGLLRRRSWRRRWKALGQVFKRSAPSEPTDDDLRAWPRPEQARSGMQALQRRGARMLFVYTGGSASYFLHPRQFQRTWGCDADGTQVRFQHWRDCDHLMFRPQDRLRLADTVGEWMGGHQAQAA